MLIIAPPVQSGNGKSVPPNPQVNLEHHALKPQTDWREQLFNAQKCGPISRVSLLTEAITQLYAIMLDVDPGLFRAEVLPGNATSAKRLYDKLVRPWLARHPVLAAAEVRNSGRGLHVLMRFDKPLEFGTDSDRARWDGILRAVQSAIPTDPDAPGITALTRPIGSINSKSNTSVTMLKSGKPVSVEAVLQLYEQLRSRPFATVAQNLFGSSRISPCPVCRKDGTTLAALDRVGQCYGECGKVSLAQLYNVFLAPRPTKDK